MRTAFSPEQLADPHLAEAERNLRACVHCGLCTATCPTYVLLGDERDAPRGRIALIQNILEKDVAPSAETVVHLDRCLSCLGCRTACPSGVDYAALIDAARLHIARTYRRGWRERALRAFVLRMLIHPALFALAARGARAAAPLAARLPGRLGLMARKSPAPQRLTRAHRSIGVPSHPAKRVALLRGCVQRTLGPAIDYAARRVLARRDIAVAPLAAGCCGSLAYHQGKEALAKRQARRVIHAYENAAAAGNVDAVLITATGCAAFLKDYPRLFADDPLWRERAERFAARMRDFVELAQPRPVPARTDAPRLAYHPPCSLQHGQRIVGNGEALLAAAGYEVAKLADSHLCCGSAGSYSLLQPEIAAGLRQRKLAAVAATGATVLASGNAGCLTHLAGPDAPAAVHIAELVDWAEGGPTPPGLNRDA